jgi:hypothetical protein
MADPLTEALKLLGFATPFAYAAATFACFHYLDNKVSDEAKTAISKWLEPKRFDNEEVARATVEIFNRVYTRPLFAWRALLRSAAITTAIWLVFFYEHGLLQKCQRTRQEIHDYGAPRATNRQAANQKGSLAM